MTQFNTNVYTQSEDSLRNYINKVFLKMGIALAITTAVAYLGFLNLAQGGFLYQAVVEMPYLLLIVVAVQLIACIVLSVRLRKMQPMTANILLYVYAAMTGITFSYLPFVFEVDTIFLAFGFAAALFFSCVVIGHTTRVDLSKFSGLMIGGLIAIVIASVVNLFIGGSGFTLIISYVGVILFLFLTAWDMQKIKAYYNALEGDEDMRSKMAVFSAFQLYLDFLNIFLYVLRILGSRRR